MDPSPANQDTIRSLGIDRSDSTKVTFNFAQNQPEPKRQNPPALITFSPTRSIDIQRETPESQQAHLSDKPALDKQVTQMPQEGPDEEDTEILESPKMVDSEQQPSAAIAEEQKDKKLEQEDQPLTTEEEFLAQEPSQQLKDRVKSAKKIRGEERKVAQIAIAQRKKIQKTTKSEQKIASEIALKKATAAEEALAEKIRRQSPEEAAKKAYDVRGFLSGTSGQEAKEYARRAKQHADIAQNLAQEGKVNQAAKMAEQAQQEAEQARRAAGIKKEQIEQENKKIIRAIQTEDKKLAATLQKEQEAKLAKAAIAKPISATAEAKASLTTRVKNWLVALFKAKN